MPKIIFFVLVAIAIILFDVLIDNLPTLFDMALLGVATVSGVYAGRFSKDLF